jgi:hypothetical protein
MKIIGLIICTNVFLLICLKKPDVSTGEKTKTESQHNTVLPTKSVADTVKMTNKTHEYLLKTN